MLSFLIQNHIYKTTYMKPFSYKAKEKKMASLPYDSLSSVRWLILQLKGATNRAPFGFSLTLPSCHVKSLWLNVLICWRPVSCPATGFKAKTFTLNKKSSRWIGSPESQAGKYLTLVNGTKMKLCPYNAKSTYVKVALKSLQYSLQCWNLKGSFQCTCSD